MITLYDIVEDDTLRFSTFERPTDGTVILFRPMIDYWRTLPLSDAFTSIDRWRVSPLIEMPRYVDWNRWPFWCRARPRGAIRP